MFKIVIHACYRRSKAFDSFCLLLYTVMPSLNKISYLILSYLILTFKMDHGKRVLKFSIRVNISPPPKHV